MQRRKSSGGRSSAFAPVTAATAEVKRPGTAAAAAGSVPSGAKRQGREAIPLPSAGVPAEGSIKVEASDTGGAAAAGAGLAGKRVWDLSVPFGGDAAVGSSKPSNTILVSLLS